MSDLDYDYGLDVTGNGSFVADTYKYLLLKGSGYTPAKADQFVAAVTPGSNEVAGTGYGRVTLASKVRTVDTSLHRITYTAANPNFGSIVAGETVTGMVLFKFVTNDADSILIAYYDLVDTPTDGTPFVVRSNSAGVKYTVGNP